MTCRFSPVRRGSFTSRCGIVWPSICVILEEYVSPYVLNDSVSGLVNKNTPSRAEFVSIINRRLEEVYYVEK